MLIDLIKSTMEGHVEKLGKGFLENKEHRKFVDEVESWCYSFVGANEETVLVSTDFYNYITYHHVIDKMIAFFDEPKIQTKEEFLNTNLIDAVNYLKEKKNISVRDEKLIKEFFEKIFEKIQYYYEHRLSAENKTMLAGVYQTRASVDNLTNRLEESGIIGKKQIQIPSKILYKLPENTILRKFVSFNHIQDALYASGYSESMLEVCLREKKIILLGEAGCGKTIALEQLAALVGDTDYFPLHVELNTYTNEDIENIIEESYPNIDYGKVFLILDAFDEIQEKDRLYFARKIKKFILRNPDIIILISLRNNFYVFGDEEGKGGLFEGFKEYGISPLSHDDIEQYIEKQGIVSKQFYNEVYKKNLSAFVNTPFYLCELIKVYARDSVLPQKDGLMREIIRNRFSTDCRKYATTKDIEDYEEVIFENLKKLAFAIQCLKTIKIANLQYQKLFRNAEIRDLIKYSGVFTKDSTGNWGFVHNNFREYLTAEYINGFDISTVKRIMFTPDGKIIDSWVNVLSFLVLIRKEDDLLNVLFETDPELVVRFERNRVDKEDRIQITCKIIDWFAEKNVWISRGLNSVEAIAEFGQSAELGDFLLKHIEKPINFRAQYNALAILSCFSDLYGRNQKVRDILFQCLKSEQVREYEKCKILEVLVSLRLYDEEITEWIIASYNPELDLDYKSAILRYIYKVNLHEKHIDLFIEEYKKCQKRSSDKFSVGNELLDVFKDVKRCEGICKIIPVLASNHHIYERESKAQSIILANAAEIYNQGHEQVFDVVFETLFEAEIYNKSLYHQCITFFEKTLTRLKAFQKTVDLYCTVDSYKYFTVLRDIVDEECHFSLLDRFREEPGKYKKVVFDLALKYDESSNVYAQYQKTVEEVGYSLPKRIEPFDHGKAMNEGAQLYFDSLFEKKQYCKLVVAMLKRMENIHMTFSELRNMNFHPVNYGEKGSSIEDYAILYLFWDLKELRLTESDDEKVLNVICKISNWDSFIMQRAHSLLASHQKIHVSEGKRSFFEKECKKLAQVVDFETEINENGNQIRFSNRSLYFIFYSKLFNIAYEKDIYLKMLSVPSFFFDQENGHENFPSYILSKLSREEINEQVRINLQEKKLCASSIDVHIHFCMENQYDWGINIANTICANKDERELRKHLCIEYLIKIRGYKYVYDNYLDTDDKEVLNSIISLTQQYDDERLRQRLEDLNAKSENERDYLKVLIQMKSTKALRRYAEILKKEMRILSEESANNYDSIVDAIGKLADVHLLDELDSLKDILFLPGFQDVKIFGLYNALYKAYDNIARQDYPLVKCHLERALQNDNISEDEKSFCNTLLIELEQLQKANNDVPWTIEQIQDFWKNVEKE